MFRCVSSPCRLNGPTQRTSGSINTRRQPSTAAVAARLCLMSFSLVGCEIGTSWPLVPPDRLAWWFPGWMTHDQWIGVLLLCNNQQNARWTVCTTQNGATFGFIFRQPSFHLLQLSHVCVETLCHPSFRKMWVRRHSLLYALLSSFTTAIFLVCSHQRRSNYLQSHCAVRADVGPDLWAGTTWDAPTHVKVNTQYIYTSTAIRARHAL